MYDTSGMPSGALSWSTVLKSGVRYWRPIGVARPQMPLGIGGVTQRGTDTARAVIRFLDAL